MKQDDITNLASLARIKLDPDTVPGLVENFETILGYVGQLSQVKVAEADGSEHLVVNQMRPDQPAPGEADRDAMLDQAPARQDRYVKVQKILASNDD